MADATVVARYGGRQVQLAMDVTGGVDGVAPAVFVTDPASSDLWFPEGTAVKIEAQPRTGFGFLKWTGALAGQPNPATLTVNGPTQAGADFTLTYALAARTVEISAAHSEEVDLQVENANLPVAWKIVQGGLPEGLALASSGRITGSAMETGTFPVVVQATDAIGLTASATLTLVVDEPVIAVDALASTFLLVGPSLTDDQLRYLDRTGNASGTYDLGDFRAWVLAHPGLPLSAPARALLASPTVFRIGNVGTVGTGRRP
jgi:hypothetical protein